MDFAIKVRDCTHSFSHTAFGNTRSLGLSIPVYMEINMNKRFILLAAFLVFTLVPLMASAKKPHPVQPDPAPVVDSCDCSAFTLVPESDPAMYETLCAVQWTTPGDYWPAYGASIEYEAEWMVDETEMSTESEAEIDDYACVFGTDDVCTASDVSIVVADHPAEAAVEFQARVKGFDNHGPTSRDFVKVSGDCSVIEP
jgi:hypothetical protein